MTAFSPLPVPLSLQCRAVVPQVPEWPRPFGHNRGGGPPAPSTPLHRAGIDAVCPESGSRP